MRLFWMPHSRAEESTQPSGLAHCSGPTPQGMCNAGAQLRSLRQSCPQETKCSPLPCVCATHTLYLAPRRCPSPPVHLPHMALIHFPNLAPASASQNLSNIWNWLQENLENTVLPFTARAATCVE